MKRFLIIVCCFSIVLIGWSKKGINSKTVYKKGDIEITLQAVRDGRCPVDMMCWWPGNAEVDLKIIKEGQAIDFTLNTGGPVYGRLFNKDTTLFGKQITLIALEPYPDTRKKVKFKRYEVTLEVTD
ncbi:MAG: hypothetical protein IIA45_10245 [Bacteroidetes bacterium]|nr:hypothetical protein [Bacteroidota bacterium]